MDKFIRIFEFAKQLFADEKTAHQASEIIEEIKTVRSPRLSDIAAHMPGEAAASYKRIQRFLQAHDPQEVLKMLFNEEAEFVFGDPTEIERPHAIELSMWARRWMGRLKVFGTRPIVFDREFSYRELLNSLVEEDVHFVIRLIMGANPPRFSYDAEQKQRLRLLIAPINQPKIYRQVYSIGEVCLNVIGIWRYGFKEPMWIMTNMEPESALRLYDQPMKIEICFRDLKSLLHIDKVMNKSHQDLDKMLAMVLLAYTICLVVGEAIRDVQYAQVDPDDLNLLSIPKVSRCSGWFLFSGPLLLLKQRFDLGKRTLRRIVAAALLAFAHLVYANVRNLVRTRATILDLHNQQLPMTTS